jgi:methylamine dehydrogenase light chain
MSGGPGNRPGMHSVDRLVEALARDMARRISRRRLIGGLGALLFGASALPLLPVARGAPAATGPAAADAGDPKSCEYWRHCAIDGFLCSCCGGSSHSCPPGTEASAITWVGTCHNPGEGTITSSPTMIAAVRAAGRHPAIATRMTSRCTPFMSNDYNWCAGSQVDRLSLLHPGSWV